MNGKVFFSVAALFALILIAVSFVWPQGLGTPSPAPFGHAVEMPDYYRMDRERTERLQREAETKARERANAAAASAIAASLNGDAAPSSAAASSASSSASFVPRGPVSSASASAQ